MKQTSKLSQIDPLDLLNPIAEISEDHLLFSS